MSSASYHDQILKSLLEWEAVSASPHRFGETEFRVGKREIGHLHGSRMVDIPFPTSVRNEIVATGEAQPDQLLSESGWVSFYLVEDEDVPRAVALLQRSYKIALAQRARRRTGGSVEG